MSKSGSLLFTTTMLSGCLLFCSSCSKKEEPPPPPPRPEPAADTTSPTRLTQEEIVALAKERLQVAKRKIAPYNRDLGLKDVVYEMYKVDVNQLFPDGNYDFTSLNDVPKVTTILSERAAAAIEPEFSEKRLAEVQDDVLVKFPYFAINDIVTAVIKRPNGSTFEKKGKLLMVNPEAITIDGTRILYDDMQSPAKWSFYKDEVENKRTAYVYNVYTAPKGEAKQAKKDELAESVYNEFGCVKQEDKWVSLKDLYQTEIVPALDKREAEYMKNEEDTLKQQIAEQLRKDGLL